MRVKPARVILGPVNQAEIKWEELQIQLKQMSKVMKVRRNARKSQSHGSDRSAHIVIFRNMVIKDPQSPLKNQDQKEQKRENSPQCGFSSSYKKRW